MRWWNLNGLREAAQARSERAGAGGGNRRGRGRRPPPFVAPPRCRYCDCPIPAEGRACENPVREIGPGPCVPRD